MTTTTANAKRPWTAKEDARLVDVVGRVGAANWSLIAAEVDGRTGKQCRERWTNHLTPDVSKATWSQEEDELITRGVEELGTKWSEIVKRLPGRTDNAIKNRYNSIRRRAASSDSAENPSQAVSKRQIALLSIDAMVSNTSTEEDCSNSPASLWRKRQRVLELAGQLARIASTSAGAPAAAIMKKLQVETSSYARARGESAQRFSLGPRLQGEEEDVLGPGEGRGSLAFTLCRTSTEELFCTGDIGFVSLPLRDLDAEGSGGSSDEGSGSNTSEAGGSDGEQGELDEMQFDFALDLDSLDLDLALCGGTVSAEASLVRQCFVSGEGAAALPCRTPLRKRLPAPSSTEHRTFPHLAGEEEDTTHPAKALWPCAVAVDGAHGERDGDALDWLSLHTKRGAGRCSPDPVHCGPLYM